MNPAFHRSLSDFRPPMSGLRPAKVRQSRSRGLRISAARSAPPAPCPVSAFYILPSAFSEEMPAYSKRLKGVGDALRHLACAHRASCARLCQVVDGAVQSQSTPPKAKNFFSWSQTGIAHGRRSASVPTKSSRTSGMARRESRPTRCATPSGWWNFWALYPG
jgi:hypothetical protein